MVSVRSKCAAVAAAGVVVIASALALTLSQPLLAKNPPGKTPDPWADAVEEYEAGVGAAPFTDSSTALGEPSRVTGFTLNEAVSLMSGSYIPAQLVTVGDGGALIVRFDEPVTDDPNNLYGVDLLVFGNSFFYTEIGGDVITGLFGEGGLIEVSADGKNWHTAPGLEADGLFPTQGYRDSSAFAADGTIPSDFTQPVDPRLDAVGFVGLIYEEALALYRGSGGGAGIDLADVGLAQVSYVRITALDGATPEVDGFADVAPRRAGDVDLDGNTDLFDLLALLAEWGVSEPGAPPADFNDDELVNLFDLLALLAGWGA